MGKIYDKYLNAKIYKITDTGNNECYIGSTIKQLNTRMAGHRYKFIIYKKDNTKTYYSSFGLFIAYGVENCKIQLIENYPCDNLEQLLARESYHINNTDDCVNMISPRAYACSIKY